MCGTTNCQLFRKNKHTAKFRYTIIQGCSTLSFITNGKVCINTPYNYNDTHSILSFCYDSSCYVLFSSCILDNYNYLCHFSPLLYNLTMVITIIRLSLIIYFVLKRLIQILIKKLNYMFNQNKVLNLDIWDYYDLRHSVNIVIIYCYNCQWFLIYIYWSKYIVFPAAKYFFLSI